MGCRVQQQNLHLNINRGQINHLYKVGKMMWAVNNFSPLLPLNLPKIKYVTGDPVFNTSLFFVLANWSSKVKKSPLFIFFRNATMLSDFDQKCTAPHCRRLKVVS